MQPHDRLRSAVELKLRLGQEAAARPSTRPGLLDRLLSRVPLPEWAEHAGITPEAVIRAAERDLRVLERHPMCDGEGGLCSGGDCHRCVEFWPCEPFRDLATVYAVDLTEGGQSNGT